EVSMHLKAYEFPRIEIEAEGAKFEQEVMPYMVQMQEQFHNMNRDEVYWDAGFDSADYDQLFDKDKNLTFDGNRKKQLEHLYTFVEVNNTENVEIEHLVEQELENNDFIDVFEGFRLYVEDCLIRPDSKSFQEFRKCDDGPYFSWLEKPSLITFDDKEGKGNSAFFDNDGTCIPTGYGTSYEFSRLEQEYMNYDGHVAIESFMQLILLEDEANWKTDPIGRYKGTIGERRDYVINNHKAVVQDIIHIATNRNVGGKIVVRDWLGEASKFKFDNELIFLDANNYFDITKNFSGEFYNYTPNMVWYFDNTDANNIIDDFSNINTINPLCYTPYHVHNSFNFSNVPATGYIPIVSGNTLANKGSYLPTTEVLTRDKGYLPIKDIKLSDHVAFVKDNGKIIWRKPDDIKRENYKGVMYNFTDYNRMSVTVTPDQDLVLYDDRLLPHTIKARKIKSDRINLPRFINDSFGLVDVNLAGTPNKALLDYIPVDERIHKNVIQYDGDVYCLIFNEYREFIPVQNEITNVDLHLLQLASEINNDYTLPKFEPIHINYTNHDKYEHHVKIDIERRDTILYLSEANTIVFDFNTANEEGKYVTFVPEFGISNVDTIKNTLGPRFDHAKNSQTFDDTGGYGFDHTAERFRVNPLTTYYDLSYAITKPPVGVEQALVKQHSPNGFASYFETTENYLNKDADGNNIGVEIFTYNMDHHMMKEFGGKPNSTLITEVYELLYPEQFGLEVTFDIANLSPPGCKNGFFDYVGNDDAIFKFDSNTANAPIFNAAAGLTFDYGKEDHCNYDSLPFDRLGRFNTYDTNRRSWDQTHDYITKTHQYIEPEQILNNSADQFLVANNENSASVRNMHPPSEQVLIRETQGSAIVATIKNYRVDLKKKFFDSVIWEFDRNYNFSVLNPLEHSGFDSTEESEKVNYRCINLFFDNDDLYLTNSTLGFVSRDIRPTSFDKESYYFKSEITTFDRQGWLTDDCEVKVIPFPFDDVHKNIATHLINHDHVQGYGPYGYSGSFDSSIPGHGFDRRNFPFFDNAQGNLKPFVRTEPTFINFDSQDIIMVHERTDVQLINHDDLRLYPQEEYCLDVTFDIENLSSIQYRNGFFDYVGTDGPIFFDGIVKYDFSHEGTPFSREGWLSVDSLQNLIPIAYTFDSNEVRTSSKNLSMDAIYLDDTAEYDFALESISYDRIGWLSYADDINGISFDYDSEHPNYDSLPESRLRENNTFDTEERNFAQTYDCITKYRQYVEPEQTLINWAQIVICVKDYITEDDVIKDFQFSVIYPYLTDQGCDPSSTKGTNATVDQNLINAPIEYMDTEISEIETIIYNPVSFIDGSLSDAHTNHLEVEIYTDIFSCDPIRYTDIIYEHRRARIQPFIDDLCPGDKEKMLFYETDFEFILMNEDTYFANKYPGAGRGR
ncbi:hypothetical protein EB155_03295, partial [archaeon]|nr:hypothetical protein [archaeon]